MNRSSRTAVLLLVLASPCVLRADSGTLEFDSEYFDLETGTVEACGLIFPCSSDVDFKFAYNADTPIHIRLFQEFPASVVFLDGVPFADVHCTALAGASFTQSLIDLPLDFDDTMLVQTATGLVFKVGEAVENPNNTVTFSFAAIPEPQAVMEFEIEYFDLETASIVSCGPAPPCPTGVDFKFVYNSVTPNHIRLFQEFPASIAFLDGIPLCEVTAGDVSGATLTQGVIDVPLDVDDTVVLLTEDGNLFLVGSAVEIPGFVVRFSYLPATIEPEFRRGDCNTDNSQDIGDAIFMLGFLFPSGPPSVPACDDACDGNDDGLLNIADAIAILTALFGSPTVPLPAPYPACGVDPTSDVEDCAVYTGCP